MKPKLKLFLKVLKPTIQTIIVQFRERANNNHEKSLAAKKHNLTVVCYMEQLR